MEAPTPTFALFTPVTQHAQHLAATNQLHAPINESSWHTNHIVTQTTPAPSAQSPALFSVVNRPPDLDYPSPASSTTSPSLSQHHHHQSENYAAHHNSSTFSINPSNESMFTQFHQVESSIGPSRVLTRRQRAALAQGTHARRASMPSSFQRPEPHSTPRHSSAMYLTPPIGTSRPQTPNEQGPEKFRSQRDRLSLNIASTVPMPLPSPTYHPMTPTSLSSPFSSYQSYDQPRSTSDSNANNQRSVSPALSNVSALTSVSSTSGPVPQVSHVYPGFMGSKLPGNLSPGKGKQRKQRLCNVDRKAICQHHQEFPTARQEDIAAKFGVERSTISKILKNKNKWLNMPAHETERVSKHRPSKFPEIEEELLKWLNDCSRRSTPLTDNSIRQKAKETARLLDIPEEKFKASSGWIENFKSRHNIRGGVWAGAKKNPYPGHIMNDVASESVLSPLNPAFERRLESGTVDSLRDVDLDSDCSPEPEDQAGRLSDHELTDPQSLQPSWSDHRVVSSSIEQSGSPHGHVEPLPGSHTSLTAHQHDAERGSQTHLPLYVDSPAVCYQPTVPIPGPNPPVSLAAAEEAMNTVIAYLDTAGRDLIQDSERMALHTVKCALFQAGSGIPFDRSRH